jgi:hypothetical protein
MLEATTFPPDVVDRLAAARQRYAMDVSAHYDEVLREVSRRVDEANSIGKIDIGAILFWKRLRADTPWVRNLMDLPDSDVRSATEPAVVAVRDTKMSTPEAAGEGRSALSGLPGFDRGDALASALLLAAAPERMAVYDRRAQKGLETLGLRLSSARGRYRRYMAIVEQLRQAVQDSRGANWLNRDVDLALYTLGGS